MPKGQYDRKPRGSYNRKNKNYYIKDDVVYIDTTKGYVILVDIIDIDVSMINWWAVSSKLTDNIYVKGYIDKKEVFIHRVIMEKMINRKLLNTEHIDHINHNGLDNRRTNLRIVTRSENLENRKKGSLFAGKPTTSKYKGVTFHKRDQKWYAQIVKDCKHIHIGTFMSEQEAAIAYNIKAKELFGNFAKLNEVL